MTSIIRNIQLSILVLMLCPLPFAQGQAADIHKKIIIQGSNSYPPFEFVNDKGEADGFNVDILRAVMQVTNTSYELQLVNWKQAVDNMSNKRIDALAGAIFLEERAKNVRFCLPHCEINRNIICRKDKPYPTLESLKNKRVVVQRGGWSEKYIKNSGLTDKITMVDEMRDALQLLESGKHDAIIGSDLVAISAIRKLNYKDLKIYELPIEPQRYSIVVAQDDEALLRLINIGLQNIKATGEYDEIYNKWFGVYNRGIHLSETIYYSLVAALILVIVAICVVAVLRRRIRNATKTLDRLNADLQLSLKAGEVSAWRYNPKTGIIKSLHGDTFAKKDITFEEFKAMLHPDDVDSVTEVIRKIEAGESKTASMIFRLTDAEGKWIYLQSEMIAQHNAKAEVKCIVGTQKDVTQQQRMESEKRETMSALIESYRELEQLDRKNKLILNNTNSGLAYINNDYVVEWENISICSAGISFEAYKKGEKCYKSAHNRDTPCEDCVFKRVVKSRNVEIIEFTFDDKKTIEVFATPVINEYNEIEGIVIRLDDITERKRIYLELEDAKEKAERSDKLKSAFLANMSHEIRTPLNAIIGFSELIVSCDDPAEKAEYSRIVGTNNELLLNLINDILELSKIESGVVRVTLVDNDLASCFNDIATMMRPRMPKGVELICENPYSECMFDFDRERLTQVVTNFMTNAIKFTSKGHIKMGYEYTGEGIRVYVEDTGIGIAEEDIPKVFARFSKVNSFAQGTGLGMTICKAIAEAAGADLGVDSVPGEGSTFWVFIPCKPVIKLKTECDVVPMI